MNAAAYMLLFCALQKFLTYREIPYKLLGMKVPVHKSIRSRKRKSMKECEAAASEKEKKEIAEMVETAKHLATHDPQAFAIAKSNMEILEDQSDMDKQEKEPKIKE